VPRAFGRRIRIDARASFTSETTLTYFGVGNASVINDEAFNADRDKYEYGWTHPTVWVRMRFPIVDGLYGMLGDVYTQSWVDVHPGSILAQDAVSPNPQVRAALGPIIPDHATNAFEYALIYDSRDDETSPSTGTFDQLDVRVAPGGAGEFPYRYVAVNLMGRVYQRLDPTSRVILAGRAIVDLKFGTPPFYELTRFLDAPAIGGSGGIRGVPGYRYYGKAKLMTNLEVRTRFAEFSLFGEPVLLSAVGFLDVGRLWSDYQVAPELDGLGLGLKFGVGAGLRFQRGSSFVLRGDLAWSPDARPIGAYLASGHMF
jgi:outer membrane protein assembly factor BamA